MCSAVNYNLLAANSAAWFTRPSATYALCAPVGGPGGAPLQMVSPGAHRSIVLGTYSGPMVMSGAPASLKNWFDGLPNSTTAATAPGPMWRR